MWIVSLKLWPFSHIGKSLFAQDSSLGVDLFHIPAKCVAEEKIPSFKDDYSLLPTHMKDRPTDPHF
jgi:hypothetical protein